MKNIFYILLLLPTIIFAQYPNNSGHKITLGEQTTADGLIYRGVASIDTLTATNKITRANKQDTSVFILLDTVTNLLWHYKIGSNAWIQAGGSTFDTTTLNLVSRFATKLNISDTASMLTNYYRSGRTGIIQASDVPTLNQNTTGSAATLTTSRTFQTNLASTSTASFNGSANVTPGVTGTLPVANGGTGSATQNFVDLTTTQSNIAGAKTFTSEVTATRFNPTSSTATGNGMFLPAANTLGFSTNGLNRVTIKSDGNVGYGTNNPVSLLHIEKAGGTTFSGGDQFRVSSGVSGNRAEFHFTDNITSDAFLSFLPSATIASRYLEISLNGAAGGLAIDGNGKVGILTVAPTQQLHVVGNGRFTAVGAGTFSNNLNITSDGTLTTATSDAKYKYNIRPLNYGLETLLQLNPVNFQWIEGEEEDLGFIAQDVAEIIPEAVNTNWNSDLLFRYESLIPILTKAIQEQQALIKALEQRIINLENK